MPGDGGGGGGRGGGGDMWSKPERGAAKRWPTRYADYPLRAQDTFRPDTPGGGGYGDLLAREAERVLADVCEGAVSKEAAERDYGVILRPAGRSWAVDVAATQARRAHVGGAKAPNAPPE